jgi:hypothetical protein
MMTSNDAAGPAADQAPARARSLPSRRAVLRTAAGAGLAATAVASAGGTALAAAFTPDSSQARAGDAAADSVAEHDGEAIVVHLRDARSGEIDLFHGTRQVRLHDRELAARLIRASR